MLAEVVLVRVPDCGGAVCGTGLGEDHRQDPCFPAGEPARKGPGQAAGGRSVFGAVTGIVIGTGLGIALIPPCAPRGSPTPSYRAPASPFSSSYQPSSG